MPFTISAVSLWNCVSASRWASPVAGPEKPAAVCRHRPLVCLQLPILPKPPKTWKLHDTPTVTTMASWVLIPQTVLATLP